MNKFEEILKDGLVAALMTADENGDFPPTTKEELLKL